MTVLLSKLLYAVNVISAVGFTIFCEASNVIDEVAAADLGRGFGDHYDWFTLQDGLKFADEHKKPVMLIIHKSWCGACKALKPRFAASKEINDLSENFVMVNVMDDEEPSDDKYGPDGKYIPRILFIGPDGDVLSEFYNEDGNQSYKFFYSDASSIITSMKKVLNHFKTSDLTKTEL